MSNTNILTKERCMAMFLRFLKEEKAFRNYALCFERSKRNNNLPFKDYFNQFFDTYCKFPSNLTPLGNIIDFSTTWILGDELLGKTGYFYGLHGEWKDTWRHFCQDVRLSANRVQPKYTVHCSGSVSYTIY